ncbi:uncharacterized protein LOC121892015 [Scomber scombrus]|uniref:Uncharacterized protein LOC121892015 n=1 Tax=Scomber scombrus TaxID=13677 RepID=A0AAV1QFG9_SCOSC
MWIFYCLFWTAVRARNPVPKPTISISCDPEMTSCVFSCDGNITGAGPVEYSWVVGDMVQRSTKEYKITKATGEQWFSCRHTNPVSSSSSEQVLNPLMKKTLLYREIGDKAVLTPDSVVNPITSIRWLHGHYVAMEWSGDETTSYGQFKDRGSLNISTGVMTITGLTRDDSGLYTAEINYIIFIIQLLVISPVPEPTISVSCDPDMSYCDLTCSGNITDAEPVTYRWTAGDKRWNSTKELKITKEERKLWFSCEFENPVSSNSSEKVFNPLMKKPLYRKIGDQVVLTPDSVENPITNIRWKHGDNIAMEWFGNEPISYRQFKVRGSLNISTGVMTITGLTRDHSGIYTAEINNKVTNKTQLLVISPVPKPNISVSCDPEMTSCVFTCSGNITDAEPVTYRWTAGDKERTSTKELKITKEERKLWFSCEFENPVSSNSSEKVFNPFMKSDQTWRLIFPIPLFILIVCIFCLLHKYIKGLKPQWQYERSGGGWHHFRKLTDPPNECSVTSDDIERQYQENPHTKMSFTVDGDPFELDFDAEIQTNLRNNSKCKIRRVVV